ncbi:MAG: FecR family protein [Candidatus Micrarchaeota archaeon]|nr:FecR family protein [Candidatus Micrarchaeota archaeon]
MRAPQYKLTTILLALIILISHTFTSCEYQSADSAKFLLVVGKCYYGIDSFKEASVGDIIPINSVVKTSSDDDLAEIEIGKNSVIKLIGKTTVNLVAINDVKLEDGKLLAKIKDKKDFRVRTSYGFASVRGTEFGVIHSSVDEASFFGVFDGSIILSSETKSIEVPKGYWGKIDKTGDVSGPFPLTEEFKRIFGYK